VVTQYHKKYLKELEITNQIEEYTQTLVPSKTIALISLERRRGIEEDVREDKIVESIHTLFEKETN
jgi:hypothetical protein